MIRRHVLAALGVVIATGISGTALAQERPLTGAEISAWIEGNTVVGVWAGDAYKQYFSADGWTDYDQAGAAVDRGRWWVTDDRFCSNWDAGGDACYRVLRDGDTLIWETSGLIKRRFTADVLPGNRLGG